MRKTEKQRKQKKYKLMCLILTGMMLGAGLFGAMNADAATEKAVANKSWESVEKVMKTKLGAGYEEVGQCTGFVYWCIKNAYGVDMGTNSVVSTLENKLISAGITKVAEGTTGKITSEMKPGDIIIFVNGSTRSHCAILGEGGKIYHATEAGVEGSQTLASWMKLPTADKNCDRYIVYRGLISTGTLTVTKASSNTDITEDNACYVLAGTKYGLYQGQTLIGSLTVNENGKASLADIPFGQYTLREISAGAGYALDKEAYSVNINQRTVSMNLKDAPQTNPVDALIYKLDGEVHESWSAENRGQYAASLEGALYSVSYYDGYYDEETDFDSMSPVRSWVIKTDESGQAVLNEENIISGDELYKNDDGAVVMPLGTVVVTEMKAPEGYVLDDTKHVVQITSSGNEETVETYVIPSHREDIIRGDISLIKVEDGSMNRMAGVPFKITSMTTGESYIMTTDVNGQADSTDIWFGNEAVASDERGGLPYDTYILDEISCEANEGHELISGVEITVYKNNTVVELGTVTNDIKKTPNGEGSKKVTVEEKKPEPASETAQTDKAVKTGDELPVWLLAAALTLMISLAGGFAVIRQKKA